MRALLVISLTCCSGSIVAADDIKKADQAKADVQTIQGVWIRVSSESSGNKRLLDAPRPLLIVAGDTFTFGALDPERFNLDPSQTPKAIDLTPTGDSAGPLKSKTYPGIYKIEGDTLTLCLSIEPGSKRPTKFATDDNPWVLDVYERQKPSAP